MNKLTVWNPLSDYPTSAGRLFHLVDSLFREPALATATASGEAAPQWAPAVDVTETDDDYRVVAELPEVEGSDVKVVVRDRVLTIQGERLREEAKEGKTFHLTERKYGRFARSFVLPRNADGEKVHAEFRNGALTVTVPKREDRKPREIDVRVA